MSDRGSADAPTSRGRRECGGLYRYVRHPMYLTVLATIVGQGLLLGRPVLLGYGAVVATAFVAFVRGYEEPKLLRTYGQVAAAWRSPRLTTTPARTMARTASVMSAAMDRR
ncbi:MAG: methyltransferase family protein [Cellulomonas sp.]